MTWHVNSEAAGKWFPPRDKVKKAILGIIKEVLSRYWCHLLPDKDGYRWAGKKKEDSAVLMLREASNGGWTWWKNQLTLSWKWTSWSFGTILFVDKYAICLSVDKGHQTRRLSRERRETLNVCRRTAINQTHTRAADAPGERGAAGAPVGVSHLQEAKRPQTGRNLRIGQMLNEISLLWTLCFYGVTELQRPVEDHIEPSSGTILVSPNRIHGSVSVDGLMRRC